MPWRQSEATRVVTASANMTDRRRFSCVIVAYWLFILPVAIALYCSDNILWTGPPLRLRLQCARHGHAMTSHDHLSALMVQLWVWVRVCEGRECRVSVVDDDPWGHRTRKRVIVSTLISSRHILTVVSVTIISFTVRVWIAIEYAGYEEEEERLANALQRVKIATEAASVSRIPKWWMKGVIKRIGSSTPQN